MHISVEVTNSHDLGFRTLNILVFFLLYLLLITVSQRAIFRPESNIFLLEECHFNLSTIINVLAIL